MSDDGLTAGAVARRLGVAVTTLRTWHQRYGLGPSRHEPGQHRRYTEQDLERLQVMRRLTAQGVAPAEAAAWAQRLPATSSRDGGGHAIAVGSATPAARGLARAAMRLDTPGIRDILEMVVTERGVVGAWNDVVLPVLVGIGERYETTKRYVEVEHLLSRCLTEVLGAVPRPGPTAVPEILLAAADEEQHTLPLEVLAAALAEQGLPCRLLGARVPPRALADAVARTAPKVVILWSHAPRTGDPAQLTALTAAPRPPLLLGAAGPGWPQDLPPEVVRLTGLIQALDLAAAAVR